MSASEAERFAGDLKTKPDLLNELKKSAAGLGLSGVVEFAKQKGYSIDVDDARSYIQGKANQELSDEQLDQIAGGKGGGGGATTAVGTGAPLVNVAGPATTVITGTVIAGPVATTVGGIIVVT